MSSVHFSFYVQFPFEIISVLVLAHEKAIIFVLVFVLDEQNNTGAPQSLYIIITARRYV